MELPQYTSHKKAKSDDEGEIGVPGKELEYKKKETNISQLIPDLFSCPAHLFGFLSPKKVIE